MFAVGIFSRSELSIAEGLRDQILCSWVGFSFKVYRLAIFSVLKFSRAERQNEWVEWFVCCLKLQIWL